jgi:hypothetical protein
MPGKHEDAERPLDLGGRDAASLAAWAAWAAAGAPVDQFPARRGAHRAPTGLRAVWERLTSPRARV